MKNEKSMTLNLSPTTEAEKEEERSDGKQWRTAFKQYFNGKKRKKGSLKRKKGGLKRSRTMTSKI